MGIEDIDKINELDLMETEQYTCQLVNMHFVQVRKQIIDIILTTFSSYSGICEKSAIQR